jgi:hypothetical protein
VFPSYTEEFNQRVRDADELFFGHIYTSEEGLRQTLLSPTAFVDEATAQYYELPAPVAGFEQVELPNRPGLLTRLGFLATNATTHHPDPIHRSLDILTRVLCSSLQTSLIDFPVIPTEREPGISNRQLIEQTTGYAPCSACHTELIDPLGFAFENFDAIGAHRETDNGVPVDTAAAFTFSDGYKTFAGAEELVALLAEEPAAHRCYSARLAEFALARDLREEDAELIADTQAQSLKDDASMKQLALAVIGSPLFTDAQMAD